MAKASWSTSPASRTMRLRSPPITRRVNAGPARVIRLVMDPAMFDSIRQGFGNNIREGALGARVLPQQRRDDARRYVYAALHWCTNHYSEICDSARELMGAGVFQTPADVSVLSNVSTRDAFALGSSNPTPPQLISPSLGNPFSNWRRVLSLIPVAAAVSLTVISS